MAHARCYKGSRPFVAVEFSALTTTAPQPSFVRLLITSALTQCPRTHISGTLVKNLALQIEVRFTTEALAPLSPLC